MSINTQKSRERIKRSTLTGVVPTVPVSADFTDGTWLNTDIRAGEFFYNIPDEKLWIGTNTVPLELTSGIGNTLADVLANGNTTGGSDIIVSSTDLIKDPTGQTYIDLNSNNLHIFSNDIVNSRNAALNIVNDFSSDTLVVSMTANDSTTNVLASLNVMADTFAPGIETLFTDSILTTFNIVTNGRHYTNVTNGSGSIANPATDIFAFIDVFMIGTNKPNVVIGNNSPGLFEQAISLSHTGMTIYTDDNLEINTPILNIIGKYNSINADILLYDDTFGMQLISSNNRAPGIIIGSQNSQIDMGVYNSVIIGGNNNQILVGQGNIISGSNNSNNTGSGNFITGINNINNGSSSIIFGSTNTNNDDYNIIGGFTNTNTGARNILSGQGNEILNNISNSLLVGSNNIMFNPGIMYGNGGVDVISNGFSSAYGNTANATPTLLTTDGTNSFKILIDTAFRVELTLLVKNINTGDAKEWKGFGIIKNVAGTTSLVGGTLTMTSTIGDVSLATTSVAVTANNTTDCLDITVTGIAATNLLWNCGIEYVLVNG